MARQWLIPGYGFIDEDGSKEYLIPGYGFFNEDAGPVLEQEGYRWRDDDGNESAATWLEDQDTAASVATEANIRLRMLVDAAAGDPESAQYQLEYKKLPSGDWKKVKAEDGS